MFGLWPHDVAERPPSRSSNGGSSSSSAPSSQSPTAFTTKFPSGAQEASAAKIREWCTSNLCLFGQTFLSGPAASFSAIILQPLNCSKQELQAAFKHFFTQAAKSIQFWMQEQPNLAHLFGFSFLGLSGLFFYLARRKRRDALALANDEELPFTPLTDIEQMLRAVSVCQGGQEESAARGPVGASTAAGVVSAKTSLGPQTKTSSTSSSSPIIVKVRGKLRLPHGFSYLRAPHTNKVCILYESVWTFPFACFCGTAHLPQLVPAGLRSWSFSPMQSSAYRFKSSFSLANLRRGLGDSWRNGFAPLLRTRSCRSRAASSGVDDAASSASQQQDDAGYVSVNNSIEEFSPLDDSCSASIGTAVGTAGHLAEAFPRPSEGSRAPSSRSGGQTSKTTTCKSTSNNSQKSSSGSLLPIFVRERACLKFQDDTTTFGPFGAACELVPCEGGREQGAEEFGTPEDSTCSTTLGTPGGGHQQQHFHQPTKILIHHSMLDRFSSLRLDSVKPSFASYKDTFLQHQASVQASDRNLARQASKSKIRVAARKFFKNLFPLVYDNWKYFTVQLPFDLQLKSERILKPDSEVVVMAEARFLSTTVDEIFDSRGKTRTSSARTAPRPASSSAPASNSSSSPKSSTTMILLTPPSSNSAMHAVTSLLTNLPAKELAEVWKSLSLKYLALGVANYVFGFSILATRHLSLYGQSKWLDIVKWLLCQSSAAGFLIYWLREEELRRQEHKFSLFRAAFGGGSKSSASNRSAGASNPNLAGLEVGLGDDDHLSAGLVPGEGTTPAVGISSLRQSSTTAVPAGGIMLNKNSTSKTSTRSALSSSTVNGFNVMSSSAHSSKTTAAASSIAGAAGGCATSTTTLPSPLTPRAAGILSHQQEHGLDTGGPDDMFYVRHNHGMTTSANGSNVPTSSTWHQHQHKSNYHTSTSSSSARRKLSSLSTVSDKNNVIVITKDTLAASSRGCNRYFEEDQREQSRSTHKTSSKTTSGQRVDEDQDPDDDLLSYDDALSLNGGGGAATSNSVGASAAFEDAQSLGSLSAGEDQFFDARSTSTLMSTGSGHGGQHLHSSGRAQAPSLGVASSSVSAAASRKEQIPEAAVPAFSYLR
ncbi:unnamed protein product [Amoebophrya sp. A120]|nr:unnamed protein product [Amoebophrya sp. A120]|eukprot:GSA120T00008564001.1